VNLLLIPGYYDVALRDLGLSLGMITRPPLHQMVAFAAFDTSRSPPDEEAPTVTCGEDSRDHGIAGGPALSV
jgi:hypothetical protein